MRRKRNQYTSSINGYRVHVTYDADTRRNAEVYINKLHTKCYGATWLDAIANARKRIREAVEGASGEGLGDKQAG